MSVTSATSVVYLQSLSGPFANGDVTVLGGYYSVGDEGGVPYSRGVYCGHWRQLRAGKNRGRCLMTVLRRWTLVEYAVSYRGTRHGERV
jgi:hypothetical protein